MKNMYTKALSICMGSIMLTAFAFPIAGHAQQSMRANLYGLAANSNPQLLDGNLTHYNAVYSNDIDMYDALKLENPGSNFGIYRQSTNLAVERRQNLVTTDTTIFHMWNMSVANYRLKLILKNLNMPETRGYLYDSYLQAEIAIGLNDTTNYDFTVDNNPMSYDPYRFKLVYGPKIRRVRVPVRNEMSLDGAFETGGLNPGHKLMLEKSTNGKDFSQVGWDAATEEQSVRTNGSTEVFYRVKQVELNNRIAAEQPRKMVVYPNPVINGYINLKMFNQPKGKYEMSLISTTGTRLRLPETSLDNPNGDIRLQIMQKLTPGIYQLQVIAPDGQKTITTLNVQ